MGVEWPYDPDNSYELTTDNLMKILAIHMRFRWDTFCFPWDFQQERYHYELLFDDKSIEKIYLHIICIANLLLILRSTSYGNLKKIGCSLCPDFFRITGSIKSSKLSLDIFVKYEGPFLLLLQGVIKLPINWRLCKPFFQTRHWYFEFAFFFM